jgi:hypothetical protein
MVKIWLFLMLLSTPDQTTVKYSALIYPTEEECLAVRQGYMDEFEARSPEVKSVTKSEAFCIPFESFPIIGMTPTTGA